MAALERELRDARRSLSGASPTAAPSTSAASVEGLVVVLPTPTDPAAPPCPRGWQRALSPCILVGVTSVGVRFILKSRIGLLRRGPSVSPTRTLCGFKSRRTSSRVSPHRRAMACHPTT